MKNSPNIFMCLTGKMNQQGDIQDITDYIKFVM